MTTAELDNLKKLAEAVILQDLDTTECLGEDSSNHECPYCGVEFIDKASKAFLRAAHPSVIIALLDEIQTLKTRAEEMKEARVEAHT